MHCEYIHTFLSDGRLAQQYEAKLQQSLQELREQQEANIKANRDDIEALYENKVC